MSWTCPVIIATMIYGIIIMYMMTVFNITMKTLALENTVEVLMIFFEVFKICLNIFDSRMC